MQAFTHWWHHLQMQNRLQIMTQFFIAIMTLAAQFFVMNQFQTQVYQGEEARANSLIDSAEIGAQMLIATNTLTDDTIRQLYFNKLQQLNDVKSLTLTQSDSLSGLLTLGVNTTALTAAEKEVMQTAQPKLIHEKNEQNEAQLRVISPVIGDTSYANASCLSCPVIKQGEVLAVVSLVLDMKEQEASLSVLNIALWVLQFIFQGVLFLIVRHIAQSISQPVVQLQQSMTRMEKESNLTHPVPLGVNQDEIYCMGKAFNSLVVRLQTTLKHINRGSEEVSNAASELTITAHNILMAAERQRHRADQVAQSVKSIRSNVSDVNSRVQQASDISQEAWSVADQGSFIVRQAADNSQHLALEVSQMADVIAKLGEESERVSGIVSTIRDIAEQTNLLALNAAIEAARAGEQGRGFAVVADEVRTLSVRTSQATREISLVIHTISHETDAAVARMRTTVTQVQMGVEYSDNAAQSLSHIRDASTRTSERIHEIAVAMKNQLQEADRIADEVADIARMTEESSSAMRHTLAASENLQSLAKGLDRQVNQFKV